MALIIRTSNCEIKVDALLDPDLAQIGRLTLTEPNLHGGAQIQTDLHPDSARLLRDALDALLRRT